MNKAVNTNIYRDDGRLPVFSYKYPVPLRVFIISIRLSIMGFLACLLDPLVGRSSLMRHLQDCFCFTSYFPTLTSCFNEWFGPIFIWCSFSTSWFTCFTCFPPFFNYHTFSYSCQPSVAFSQLSFLLQQQVWAIVFALVLFSVMVHWLVLQLSTDIFKIRIRQQWRSVNYF